MNGETHSESTEVAIVGAGPVGLVLALLLADYGVKVSVYERSPQVSDEPRAVSIVDESLRTLGRIGIYEALKETMLLDTRTRYFGSRGQLLAEVEPSQSPFGYPAKGNFDQPELERSLAEAAERNESVDVHWNTEVVSIDNRSDCVRFTTKGHEGLLDHTAKYLIGCDGGRSFVRKSQGIELVGSTQVEKWIVIDMLNDPHRDPVTEFHANGRRPTVIVPGQGGRCRYEFMLLDGEAEEKVSDHDFIATLLSPYRRYKDSEVRRARVYVAQQRVAEKFRRGRVFLAGDSAHLMPPFAGQGLNAGIRDAANLAWKIETALRGRGSERLLNTYEQERLPHATEMVKLSARLGKAIMAVNSYFTVGRDFAVRASRWVRPVNNWLTTMKFIKPPRVTEGCAVFHATRKDAVSRREVGNRFPRPLITTEDGVDTPLDEVLGERWALLAFGAPATNPLSNPGVQTIVKSLNPKLVRVNSSAETVVGGRGFQEVIFGGRELGRYHHDGEASRLVLIRPDRYIAAVFTTDQGVEVSAALAEWFPI